MRLTGQLRHAKYFWWGKGWGPKPRINTDQFYYRMIWKAKRRRKVEVIEQKLPEGCQPVDPNRYVQDELNREFSTIPEGMVLPWPYSKRPIKGTPEDPNYQKEPAWVYQRQKQLVEPVLLPLYFTNSILENGLPDSIVQLRNQIKIDEKFLDYFQRRIQWPLKHDAALRKLPLDREFPYLDQRPPRVWGATVNRKELNLLQTLYDISGSLNAKLFGFNPNVIIQRVSYPNCVYPSNRNGKLTLLDLECDFMSLVSPTTEEPLKTAIFDPNYKQNASHKPLQSIDPISWEVGFDRKHFYPKNFEFKIPAKSEVHTIYLSNNHVRKMSDENYQGRSVMFCYGYAMQQAKLRNLKDPLETPIIIQCLYTSPREFNIGFVLFQLNSLDPENELRNQAWFSEPRSITEDAEQALVDLAAIQSFRVSS